MLLCYAFAAVALFPQYSFAAVALFPQYSFAAVALFPQYSFVAAAAVALVLIDRKCLGAKLATAMLFHDLC